MVTDDRIGSTDFSVIGAGLSTQPVVEGEPGGEAVPDAVVGPLLDVSSGATWRYSRDTVDDRIEYSAKPSGCHE